MKRMKLWLSNEEDDQIGLLFYWNDETNSWICEMDNDFFLSLGPLPVTHPFEE